MASREKTAAPPKRLPRAERREQLTNVALEIAAERGYQGLELEEVAERAGVARSLLYRYFPEGRQDLYLAAADQAGRILASDWVTDDSIPLGERLARNFGRIIDHAAERSDAWRLYRQARASADPELVAIGRRYHGGRLESISRNHLGTDRPPELVLLALPRLPRLCGDDPRRLAGFGRLARDDHRAALTIPGGDDRSRRGAFD